MKIYCVKIRQSMNVSRNYFPFERMYLVPDSFLENDYWKGVFKYMLVVETPTLELLTELGQRGLRNDLPKEVKEGHRVVIPTYTQNGKLGYMWSYLKRAKLQGLELSLYTPHVVIPSLCHQCINLPQKYTGGCHLVGTECRRSVNLIISKQREGEDTTCLSASNKHPSRKSISQTSSPTSPY